MNNNTFLVILIGIFIYVVYKAQSRTSYRRPYYSGRNTASPTSMIDVHDVPSKSRYEIESELVQGETFGIKAVLNIGERKIYWEIIKLIKHKKMTVLPQVALGEVLSHQDKNIHSAITGKRCDFILVDMSSWKTILAIELDGSGHHLSPDSKVRDDIKRRALQAAGVPLISIKGKDDLIVKLNRFLSQC